MSRSRLATMSAPISMTDNLPRESLDLMGGPQTVRATPKRVFVAGGAGMVGSGIIKHLLAEHRDVRIFASVHGTEPFLDHDALEFRRADLASLEDCRAAVRGCDAVVMAAAHTTNAKMIREAPFEILMANLRLNTTFLEACRLEGIRRVVFIGSATVYQDFAGSIREDMLDLNQEPHGAYFGFGWAGRFTEKVCELLHREYGMDILLVRASNVFGPFAKFDPETSNFIPALIRKAVDRLDPFEVWGHPEVARDVIFVDDFAAAVVRLLSDGALRFGVFNVGSGTPTTVESVVRLVLMHAGHTPSRIVYDTSKPTTMPIRVLDCSKARDALAWKPEIGIEEGIRRTVEWWKDNKGWWTR